MQILLQPLSPQRQEWVDLARKENFRFEVFELSVPFVTDDPDASEKLIKWYAGNAINESLHGAFMDINPGSGDPKIAKVSKDRCEQSCDIARTLGCRRVVFHASAHPFLYSNYLEYMTPRCVDYYTELSARYPEMTICIENSMDAYTDSLVMLMKAVDSPRIRVCLDIGHVFYSNEPVEKWFDVLGEYIDCLHLSDNNLKYDDHLAVGDGKIPWKAVHRAWTSAGCPGSAATIEVGNFNNVLRSIDYMKKNSLLGL